MPPAKKSTSRGTRSRASSARTTRSRTSSARSRVSFKEPAALKKLSKSLESASAALGELQKQSGRDVSKTARDLYKDMRSFLSNASRHSGRLTTALQRDFEKANRARKATATRSSRTRKASAKSTSTSRRRRATTSTRSPSRAKSRSSSR